MARITVEDCIDKFPSRFELVLVASQRAKKLHSGEDPTVEKDNDKNTVIALREIADQTITSHQMKESLIQEYQTVTINDEEEENLEIESNVLNKEIIPKADHKTTIIENDILKDNNESKNIEMITSKEVEEEMNDLISAEDNEIESQYEVADQVEKNETLPSNEDQEDINTI